LRRDTGAYRYGGMAAYGSPPQQPSPFEAAPLGPSGYLGPLDTELSSRIFGVRQPQLPGPLANTALLRPSTYVPGFGQEEAGEPGAVAAGGGPLDLRLWPEQRIGPIVSPMDVYERERAAGLLAESALRALPQASGLPAVPDTGVSPKEGAAAVGAPGVPELRDTSMLPGSDVFTDMQLALALSLNPQAEWYAAMQQATRESPRLSPEMQERAALAAEDFLTRVLNAPLQTFVGEGASGVNDELRRAEAEMDSGRYYDAVRCYERARLVDPLNPLPVIGKAHALLAAGEYVSAALNLIRGLERFAELARFRLDLTALLGGGEIVDIRRSDLMRQLGGNEDPQLRFLLGYLEIHTGNRELGMQNLDQAAREAPPGSLIRRYPDLIRQRGMLPAPKLPPDAVPAPATEPGLLDPRATDSGEEGE
jgi:tetratricopeptide (TPR) repeat protein